MKKNFSGIEEPVKPDGVTEFVDYNFSMPAPIDTGGVKTGWPLAWGTGLTFTNCNFVNREPPAGSACVSCNTTIKEDDVHNDSDYVIIGGQSVEIKYYANVIYGKYDIGTSNYTYFPSPKELPCDGPEEEE